MEDVVFTQNTLNKAIQKLFKKSGTVNKIGCLKKYEGISKTILDPCFFDMSEKEIIKAFVKEYSNKRVLEYVRNNFETLTCFSAAEGTELYLCLSSLIAEYPLEFECLENSVYVPMITDELVCYIGSSGYKLHYQGNCSFSTENKTYITEKGKILCAREYCYYSDDKNDTPPSFIFRKKIKNDNPCADCLECCIRGEYQGLWDWV